MIAVLFMSGVLAETSRKQHGPNAVRINKCCEANEILLDLRCSIVNSSISKFRKYVFNIWTLICIFGYIKELGVSDIK